MLLCFGSGNLVVDDAVLHILLIGQPEMLFWNDIASIAAPRQSIIAAPIAEVMWS
jgi:hypothetical protein